MTFTERQNTEVSASVAASLLGDPSFTTLLDSGLLELVRTRNRVSIRGTSFVGHATLASGLKVTIAEKVPGALAGMLPWASPADVRDVLTSSEVTKDGMLVSVLLDRFLDAVAQYIHCRKKAYIRQPAAMLSPRGRIVATATARLRARGKHTRVACAPLQLSADLPPNALIALALLSVESWVDLPGVSPELIIKARCFLPFFSEFDFCSLRRMPWPDRSREFHRELHSPFRSRDLERVLGYARPIALHAISALGADSIASVPVAFFLNLESLFEDAVLNCLKRAVGDSTVQRPAEASRLPILDANCDRYRASPDALCMLPAGHTLVADCKYKALDGRPGHADLYQILAHADAYAARSAVLVYPGDVFACRPLGMSRSGVQVYYATVRCTNINVDIQALAAELLD